MKYLLPLFVFLFVVQVNSQNSEIVVQASHSDAIMQTAFDSPRNLFITFGNYSDYTLKFWNKKTGTLIKTLDLNEFLYSLEVDEATGTTYLGTRNEVIIIDNSTLKIKKRFKVENLKQLIFNKTDGQLYIVTGFSPINMEDESNMKFIKLNSITGNSSELANWPVKFEPISSKISGNNGFIIYETQYEEWNDDYTSFKITNKNLLYYHIATNKFTVSEGENNPVTYFKNMDMLYIDYMDATHVKVKRYNGYSQKYVWEKVVVVENINRNVKPHKGQVALSKDDSKLWIAPGKSTLIELNPETGEVKGVIYTKTRKDNIVADANYVYAFEIFDERAVTKGNYNKYLPYSNNPIVTFGHQIVKPSVLDFSFQNDEISMITSNLYNEINSLSFRPNGTQLVEYNTAIQEKVKSQSLKKASKNSQFYFASIDSKGGALNAYKIGNSKSEETILNLRPNYVGFEINSDKNIFAIAYENKEFEIIDLDSKKTIFSKKLDLKQLGLIDFYFSESQPIVIVSILEDVDPKFNSYLIAYNYKTGKELWRKKNTYYYNTYSNVFFISNNEILVTNVDTDKAEVYNVNTGKEMRAFTLPNIGTMSVSLLNGSKSKLITFNKNEEATVFEISTGRILNSYSNFSGRFLYKENFNFVTDEVYSFVSDGTIKFHNAISGEELLRLYIFRDGEWLAHTPEGLFDGSQNAWNRVIFVKGKETIPLNQVFDQFYTPRLLYKILRGEIIEKPEVEIDDLKNVPTVEISYSEGTRNLTVEDDVQVISTKNSSAKIMVHANANRDRISEIRLYHNGKRVGNKTRNLTVEDDDISGNSKVFNITLLEGENTFEAIAINSQKTESSPQTLIVNYEKEVVQKSHGIQVYLLVVGIDKYKNPKYNLNYAVADANAFKESINKGMKSFTSNI
ncbi:MAG: hypothetical protein QM499_12390, partial [Flavobacteriaceae bacterium]